MLLFTFEDYKPIQSIQKPIQNSLNATLCYPTTYLYRVVQVNFTTEIEVFYMVNTFISGVKSSWTSLYYVVREQTW